MRSTMTLFCLALSCMAGPALRAAVAGGSPAAPREAMRIDAVEIGRRHGVPVYRTRFLSPVYTVDRIYRSMMGPWSTQTFPLLDGEPEVLWMIGYHAEMKGADGITPRSPSFMCHSNLGMVVVEHRKHFPTELLFSGGRLFTLSQGQLDIEFPRGFGIPIMSDQELYLTTQVLNHNIDDRVIEVRHDVSVEFVRDSDLEEPYIPLVQGGVNALKLVEGERGYYGLDDAEIDPKIHGPGCELGESAPRLPGTPDSIPDRQGRKFTSFWVVEPGREENHSLVTNRLYLAYDTTIHYIAVHLHPFAESIELRDLTSDRTLFKSRARQVEEGIGLDKVEHYSSRKGIPIFVDHEYELVTVYNNTTNERQDSMATVLLFLRATDLEAELRARRAAPGVASGPAAD